MKRTNWQLLADARARLGDHSRALAPRYGERPDMVDMTSDRIVVVLSSVRMRDVRGGTEITHRGLRWYTFNRVDGEWAMDDPVVVENKLAQPERLMSFGVTSEDEYTARREWEDLCYRPGTPNCPMDTTPRQQQRESIGY